ncbi:MAG: YfhO family protein [Bifidobacteriaceae bacterium]|jgi:hypothetical protein|nr:YfhO family protein [Bifidobacteriaceae bacterium]
MRKKFLSNISLFKGFTKCDYFALLIIEILLFSFFAFLILYARHLGFVYATDADPFLQHIAFPNDFRMLFYQNHELIPQFIPNLGGGQNAFNFAYYGLGNPLIIFSYLLPFLSIYHYWVVLNVTIVMISTALLYIWLRGHFASIPTIVATICFALSDTIIFHTHQHYMFIDYFPFLIITLMAIDRIDFSAPFSKSGFFSSKAFLLLIVCTCFTSLISYFYIPGCFICIGLYTIFVWLEKNPKKFNFKKFIFDMLKVIGSLLVGLMLAMFILLPTFLAVSQSTRQSIKNYSVFDLLFPTIDNFSVSTTWEMASTLGFGGAALIVAGALAFSKKKHVRVVTILFLILTCIPVFSFIANGAIYKSTKSLIPLILIAVLFIATAFAFIQKHFKAIKFVNYKFAISFLSGVLILSIGSSTILNNIPSKENKYQIDSVSNKYLDPKLTEKIKNTLAYNSGISRSAVINENPVDEYPYNVIFDKNYFSSGVYSSVVSKSWVDYVHQYTWSPFTSATSVIAPTYSPLASVILGNKYAFSLDDKPPFSIPSYKQVESGVWQNDAAFSLGYATDKTYSDIKNFNNKQTVASLISGIDIDNNLNIDAYPDVSKFKNVDLSKTFLQVSDGKSSFPINVTTDFTYKLPEVIKDRLLFIEIDLPKSPAADRVIYIDNSKSIYAVNDLYDNENNHMKFVVSPDESGMLKELNLRMKFGKYTIENIKAFTMPVSDLLNAHNQFDQMVVKSFDTSGLKGDINITRSNSTIAFSIPYDKGFTLRVDGKRTDIFQVNGGIIGANIDKGHHEIELTYEAPGFKIGIIISAVSLFLLIGFYSIMVYRKKKYNA